MFSFGELYLEIMKQQNAFKQVIVEKVKRRGGKLNQKEIRFIEAETGFRAATRPTREQSAAIIKSLAGHTIIVRKRGNPSTLSARERDLLLCEANAEWKGTRASFIDTMAIREGKFKGKNHILDVRTIERALQKGEQYMKEDIEKIRARLLFLSLAK